MDKKSSECWYFTFMLGQGDLGFKFVKIEGTYAQARKKMVQEFGTRWGFQYSEKDFAGQAEKYGLSELVI